MRRTDKRRKPAGWAIATLAGGVWLAGCASQQSVTTVTNQQTGGVLVSADSAAETGTLTGNHGGLLPGLVAPAAVTPASGSGPSGLVRYQDQAQPDGTILRTEWMAGVLYSQTWYTRQAVPVRAIYFQDGTVPVGLKEFGPDGKLTRVTEYYPGTSQPERVEEYADGYKVARFTTYWPNGVANIVSEADVITPAGPVNRVRQWYEDGQPKSLAQHMVVQAQDGSLYTVLQGRQMEWDDHGVVVADSEFDHDVMMVNYLAKKPAGSP
jgi:hypothetical protein